MEQEYENLVNEEELGAQLIQECIADLKSQQQRRDEALAACEAEKEVPLPACMKKTNEGFLQYEESSCLPTPHGENIGLRRIGTNQIGSKGQVTEMWYTIDDMLQLAREMDTDGLGSEMLYQKIWAHVKSTLPIERKENYAKEMVRTAIVMYTSAAFADLPEPTVVFRSVIFSDGECKITVDDSHEDNYDRAMKFIV